MTSPQALQQAWRRLAKADELVQGFGERGWIVDETLVVVGQRTGDLARRVGRVEAREEAAREELAALRREIEDLTALLVALADEAVSRQPSLAPEVPVPVSLADAQRRLADTTARYGELS